MYSTVALTTAETLLCDIHHVQPRQQQPNYTAVQLLVRHDSSKLYSHKSDT